MLGDETIPDGESDAIRAVVEASRAMLAARGETPARRQQHAKHHGCVRAEFVVEPDLPPPYRVGLFREPATYAAWVRFSNGTAGDDRRADAHGMAVKLMGVPGPKVLGDAGGDATHDFVMIDNPRFFIRDAAQYADFSAALLAASGVRPSRLYQALRFLPPKPRRLLTLVGLYFVPFRLGSLPALLSFAGKRPGSPLASRYWSATPYLFGEKRAMKFSAVPDGPDPAPPAAASADYLREAMADRLREGGVSFDFRVQLQKDEARTPVEDPTVEWPESVSPFRTVARIRIPAQEFQSAGQMAFCENLSFNPWHAGVAHRPLGGINRVRKGVYLALSADRHGRNGTPAREPGPADPPAGPPELADPTPTTFDKVLGEELDLIRKRRAKVELPEPVRSQDAGDGEGPSPEVDKRIMNARVAVLDEQVTGLAFSGGGIRSATFAVGFLQGLAMLDLVTRFDYLSTVSGGGYAGAWLAAWLKRDGDPANVQRLLNVNRVAQKAAAREFLQGQVVDEEPEPLRHLREYSSYLSPTPGLLSLDTWTVILIWVRNVAINLMMLIPAGMMVVVAARAVVYLYGLLNIEWIDNDTPAGFAFVTPLLMAVGVWALFLAFSRNGAALAEFRRGDVNARVTWPPGQGIGRRVVAPALGAVVLLTMALRGLLGNLGSWFDRPATGPVGPETAWRFPWDFVRSNLGLLDPPNFALHAVAIGLPITAGSLLLARRDGHAGKPRFALAAFMAGATGGVLLVLIEALVRRFSDLGRPDLMATFVPPLALLTLVAGLVVEVALLGRTVEEAEREWWARLSAALTLAALWWTGVVATVLYVPALFLAAGAAAKAAIASGWLATAAFGVVTGRYVLPRAAGKGLGLTALASLASQVFLVGLLGAVALLGSVLLNVPAPGAAGEPGGDFPAYLVALKGTWLGSLIAVGAVSFLLFLMARRLIDVNLFSLHAMYTNRLTRAYLGASRRMKSWAPRWAPPRDTRVGAGSPALDAPEDGPRAPSRSPNPETGFDPKDDIPLADLMIGKTGPAPADRTYWGPLLLVNTTLNLVGGSDLAWRSRKGESFTLSPLYCGSKRLGYSKAAETREAMTLGRAVAISGAAVDPNMSFYQSAPLTALLTIFNARLGYWLQAPTASHWRATSPKFGDLLFTEFFGRTDNTRKFVHISDGGHFENMGVYELIRRRCRYVVAVDAGEDDDPSDDNLANLIRLSRIDFGVRIRIDTGPLRVDGPDRLTKAHVAIGRIHYDDVDQGEMPGVLVYVKISMTGDEPPDLQKYAKKAPAFPHQPTDLRQEFDEEQFESYRALGDHIAREVFADAVEWVRRLERLPSTSTPHNEYVPKLFSAVQLRWAEAPRDGEPGAAETGRAWSDLRRDLATQPDLAGLFRQLYPETVAGPATTSPATAGGGGDAKAELTAVARMLDVAEQAWLSLGLDRFSGLAVNRGWMNAFRRWAVTDAFRTAWPTLRTERSAGFVRFCEDQLHASAARPSTLRVPSAPAAGGFEDVAVARLGAEFAREWPADVRRGRGIADLIARADSLGLGLRPVWLIVDAPSGGEWALDSAEKFVCGIVLAAAFPDHPDALALNNGGKPPVELFVWVRPPYRTSSLATLTVPKVIEAVSNELAAASSTGDVPPLWTRYPKPGGGDNDRELALWMGFFARYDFRRRYVPPHPAGKEMTLLERTS